MADKKYGTHDKCYATVERNGATLICSRSKGHLDYDTPLRRLHYDVNHEAFWFERLRWVQIEPRRRYRAEYNGASYDLLRQGSSAPQAGWYLEGGLDGKGHEFMAKRLEEATEEASHRIAQHIGGGRVAA